jgi:hypothetical protein
MKTDFIAIFPLLAKVNVLEEKGMAHLKNNFFMLNGLLINECEICTYCNGFLQYCVFHRILTISSSELDRQLRRNGTIKKVIISI